jgi:hypothetical protein
MSLVDWVQVMTTVLEGTVSSKPLGCPVALYSMMLSCWQYMPDNRPTFKDLSTALEVSAWFRYLGEPMSCHSDTHGCCCVMYAVQSMAAGHLKHA